MAHKSSSRISWLFDLYIKSSLHVALAVTAFAFITIHQFQLDHNPALYSFIFCSTVVSYNLTKYLTLTESDSIRLTPLLKCIGIITGCALVAMVSTLFYLKTEIILAAILLGVVTAGYALPVSENRKNLRHVYGIKILIIAFVWAAVTVGLPFINHGADYTGITPADMVLVGFQRFIFVAVLVLPFDIRDLRNDAPGLGTIPQIAGVKQTKRIGILLLITCLLIEVLQYPVLSNSFFILLFICVITALMVQRSMDTQSAYFASFRVEGIPIFWAFLLSVF